MEEGEAPLPGAIGATANVGKAAGGHGVAVPLDYCDEDTVRDLFDRRVSAIKRTTCDVFLWSFVKRAIDDTGRALRMSAEAM